MKIFEKFFFDSVQYVRYDQRRKFDADRRIIGISAIFQILPTRSCCYGVKGLSTTLGIEPRSLTTGSKQVVHWTSETWCECSEIAGSTHTVTYHANRSWSFVLLLIKKPLEVTHLQTKNGLNGLNKLAHILRMLFTQSIGNLA